MRIRCLARFEKVAICAPCVVPDSKTEIYQQAQGQPQTQHLSGGQLQVEIRKLDWYFRHRLKQANTMAGSEGLWKNGALTCYPHGSKKKYGSQRRIRVINDLPKSNKNNDLDKTATDTLFSWLTFSTVSFRWSSHYWRNVVRNTLLARVVHICETNARATLELDGAESRGTIRLIAKDFPKTPRLEYMTLSHSNGRNLA